MSIRRTKSDDASRHPLMAVRAAGAAPRHGLGTQPSAVTAVSIEVSERNLNPPHVVQTPDGTATISTTPSVWTGLTTKEIVKLKLKPENEAEFAKNGYEGTAFKMALDSHRFYVHPNGANEIAYCVLARPYGDKNRYYFK
jgi:hypothetical protein